MLWIVLVGAARHLRPHRLQTGIPQCLHPNPRGVVSFYGVVAEEPEEILTFFFIRPKTVLVCQMLQKLCLLLCRASEKRMSVEHLGSSIHPPQAGTEMFADCAVSLAIDKVGATENHEIDELGDASVVCTGVVIRRNNKISQSVQQLEFLFSEKLGSKRDDRIKSGIVSRDFMTASKPPAPETRKGT